MVDLAKLGKRVSVRLVPMGFLCLSLLVTGCPHNEYVLDLNPQGASIGRELVYFCADGTNKNTGEPNYLAWDTNEAALIKACYPAEGQTNAGSKLVCQGVFKGGLPPDIGGAGTYTNLVTRMGEAGLYLERFRGNDNLAALTERRRKAADGFTDLIMGWSRNELRHEDGYPQLSRFLDREFRQDVRNAGEYLWEGQTIYRYNTNAAEEFIARFGQYLLERGYFTPAEVPELFRAFDQNGGEDRLKYFQRWVARRLGVPDSQPVPKSLYFLADESTLAKSLTNYLVTTKEYRVRYEQWKRSRLDQPGVEPPNPMDILDEDVLALLQTQFDLGGTPDHLTVRLHLPVMPTHSNGTWDAAGQQVIWNTDLVSRTNTLFLPHTCFATWARADESFQAQHFGRVMLSGDELVKYCLWRASLTAAMGREWDDFVEHLQPGPGLVDQLKGFQFSAAAGDTAGRQAQFVHSLTGGNG